MVVIHVQLAEMMAIFSLKYNTNLSNVWKCLLIKCVCWCCVGIIDCRFILSWVSHQHYKHLNIVANSISRLRVVELKMAPSPGPS